MFTLRSWLHVAGPAWTLAFPKLRKLRLPGRKTNVQFKCPQLEGALACCLFPIDVSTLCTELQLSEIEAEGLKNELKSLPAGCRVITQTVLRFYSTKHSAITTVILPLVDKADVRLLLLRTALTPTVSRSRCAFFPSSRKR